MSSEFIDCFSDSSIGQVVSKGWIIVLIDFDICIHTHYTFVLTLLCEFYA